VPLFFHNQKFLLGFAVAIIYIPLRTFLNVREDLLTTVLSKLPLFSIEILISTLFFSGFIYLTERGVRKIELVKASANSYDFQFSTQLLMLVPAVLMAIAFNWLLTETWGFMNGFWSPYRMPIPSGVNRAQFRADSWRANQALTVLALVAAYYLCISNQMQMQLKRLAINTQLLEKENFHARFQALKNQISPHFLFNNLSVLASLVESQPEKSSEFISQLSTAYRYILQQAELDRISLKDEIHFMETYSFLLRTRFKEKVIIQTRVSARDLAIYSLIPLTLHLLIENAIKHNTMSASNPLTISIYIEKNMLVVSNPKQLRILSEPSTRLGLKNIINRYNLLLQKKVIVLSSEQDFTVKIPLLS